MEDRNNNFVKKEIPYFELVPERFLIPPLPIPDYGPFDLPFPEYCGQFSEHGGEKEGTVVLYPGQFPAPPRPKKSILGELILRQFKVEWNPCTSNCNSHKYLD